MSHAVLIRRDARGTRPVLVREGELLETPPGVSWQFVGAFASESEACHALERVLAETEVAVGGAAGRGPG